MQRPKRTVKGEWLGQLHEGDVIAQPLWLVLAVVNDFIHQMGGHRTVQGHKTHLDGPGLGVIQAEMNRLRGESQEGLSPGELWWVPRAQGNGERCHQVGDSPMPYTSVPHIDHTPKSCRNTDYTHVHPRQAILFKTPKRYPFESRAKLCSLQRPFSIGQSPNREIKREAATGLRCFL